MIYLNLVWFYIAVKTLLLQISNKKNKTAVTATTNTDLHWVLWSRAWWRTRGQRWQRGRKSSSHPRCISSLRCRTAPISQKRPGSWQTPCLFWQGSVSSYRCCCLHVGLPSLATPPGQGWPHLLVNFRKESEVEDHWSWKRGWCWWCGVTVWRLKASLHL